MAFKKKNPVIKDMMNSTKEEIEAKYTKEEYIKPTTKKEKTKEEKEKEEAHSKSIIANTKRILDEGRQEWDNRNRPGHAIELGMGPVIPETEITVTDAKGNPKTMTAAQAGFRQKQNNILGLIKTNAEERREAQKNGATAEELMLFDNRATDYTNQYKSLSPRDYNKNKAYIEEQIKMGDDDYATGVETTRSFYHNVDSFGKESGGNKARQSAFADLESMATKAPKFFKENGIAFISTYAGMLSEDEIEKESAKLSNIMYDSIWTPELQAEYEAVSSVVNNANQKRNSSMNLGNVDQKGVRANVTYGYTYTPEEEAAIKRKAELEMIRSEAESMRAETDYYVTREWELSKYKDKYGYNWYTGTSEKADKKTSSRLIKWLYEDNFDRSAAAISDDSPNFEASVRRYELYQKAEKGEADSDDIKAAFKQIYGVDLSDKDLARLTIIAKEDDFSALSRYFSDIVIPDMNRAKEGKIAKSYEDIINNGSWLGKQGALAGGLFLSMLSSPYAAIESIGDAVDSNIKKTELPTYKTHLGYGQFSSIKSGIDKGRAELGTVQNADVLEFLGMDRKNAEAWGGGIYGLTNSIAENLARSPLGVFGGAAMMFAQSFTTEYKSGVDAYSDPTKNAIMSTVTAFSEGLTEKIELGALNKALDMTRFNPNHFKRMVKAARLSGANEVLGELTNDAVRYISDYALNGEESELYQQARKLVVDGKAADVGSGMMQILIKNGLNTAVVSYISGVALGGARGLFNYAGVSEADVRRDGEKLITGGLNINELVRLGKESTNPETKKLALTIEQAVANGEGLDGFDVQMLFSGILNDSADEKIDVGETDSIDVKVPMQSEGSAEQNGDMESTINEAILDANNEVKEANTPEAVKELNKADTAKKTIPLDDNKPKVTVATKDGGSVTVNGREFVTINGRGIYIVDGSQLGASQKYYAVDASTGKAIAANDTNKKLTNAVYDFKAEMEKADSYIKDDIDSFEEYIDVASDIAVDKVETGVKVAGSNGDVVVAEIDSPVAVDETAKKSGDGGKKTTVTLISKDGLKTYEGVSVAEDTGYELTAVERNGGITIVEKRSGMEFAHGATVEEAVANVRNKIAENGKDAVDAAIEKAIERRKASVNTSAGSTSPIEGDRLSVGRAVADADYTNTLLEMAKTSKNENARKAAALYSSYDFKNDNERYRALGDIAKMLGVSEADLVKSRAKSLFAKIRASISSETDVVDKTNAKIYEERQAAVSRGDTATVKALDYLTNLLNSEGSIISVSEMFAPNQYSAENPNVAVQVYGKRMETAFKNIGLDISVSVYYDSSENATRGEWIKHPDGHSEIKLNGAKLQGEQSAFFVVSHELIHEAESKSPGITQRMLDAFTKMGMYDGSQYEAYKARYNAVCEAEFNKELDRGNVTQDDHDEFVRNYVNEEIVADLMSETMSSSELVEVFAGKLGEDDANVIVSFLKKLLNGVKKVFNSKDEFPNKFSDIIGMFEGAVKNGVDNASNAGYNNTKYSYKHWHTNLSNAEVSLIENWLKKARRSENNTISKKSHWYEGFLDDNDLFVIYSAERTNDPTILYLATGTEAIEKKQALQKIMEVAKNEISDVKRKRIIDGLLGGDWNQAQRNLANSDNGFGDGDVDIEDAPILQRTSSKPDGDATFEDVVRTLLKRREQEQNGRKVKKKFALSSTVEKTPELIAVHNVHSNKLPEALDLGGLPMPSIAVTKAGDAHDMFGDVSFVFGRETIDPQADKRNKLYGGDAYTPTRPQVAIKIRESAKDRFSDIYYDYQRKFGDDYIRPLYPFAEYADEEISRMGGIDVAVSRLKDDTKLMQAYLQMQGKKPVEPVMIETETKMDDADVMRSEFFVEALGEDAINAVTKPKGMSLSEHLTEYYNKYGDKLKSAYARYLSELLGFSSEEISNVMANYKNADAINYIVSARNFLRNGSTKVESKEDYQATQNKIREAIKGTGYSKWIDSLFDDIIEKRGIRNNRDLFTPSGNRRGFEELYYEYNLENVVKAMSQGDKKGISVFGGSIFGASTKNYKTVEEARADSDRLKTIDEDEYSRMRSEFFDRLHDISDRLAGGKDSRDAEDMLVEAVAKYTTPTGIKNYLARESKGFYNYTDEIGNEFLELVGDIANMPTGYFEAKPERAVDFSEVAYAVVPDDMDADIRKRLEEVVPEVKEYRSGDSENRTEVLNSEPRVRFALTGNMVGGVPTYNETEKQKINHIDAEYLELAKNPEKNEARLREMVEEAAKANGYTNLFYHGAKKGGGFTEFYDWQYFTENEQYAKRYAKREDPTSLYKVYAKLINPFDTRKSEDRKIFERIRSEYGLGEIQDTGLPDWTDGYDISEYIDENELTYDGIILDEGGDLVEGVPVSRGLSYVIRKSAQIKSGDLVTYDDDGNVIPLSQRFNTEKNDTRYSLDDTGVYSLEDAWAEMTKKYGAISKGMNPARDVKVPKKISENQYVSRTAKSAIESGLTPAEFVPEFQKDILDGKFTYERFTDEKAEQKAKELIEYHGFEDALRHWDFIAHSGGAISKENFAFGIELYNQCAQNGDFKNAEKILADISAEATIAGQAIQAMSMLKKMSPDGTLYYLERSIDKINDELVAKFGEKRAKKVKINEELAKRYFAEKDAEKREELYKELCKDIGEQIPSTFWEKEDAWRYLSMLFNPTTHMRNFAGNILNLIVTKINNTIEGAIQPIFIKQEDRTKTLKRADKKTAEFAKNDWKLMKDMLTSGEGKYGNVVSDIDKYRRILRPTKNAGKVTKVVGNALGFAPEMLNKFNSWALEKEDELFLGVSYRSALKKIITARKLDVDNISSEELSKIREIAIKEAKRATFREANALAEAISKTRAKLMKGNLVDKAGGIALGGLFPFTKTPMNITKQSLETSPLGVFKTAYDVVEKSRGKAVSGNDIIADVARTFTGTGLFILGAVLARAGVVSAGDDEDKDKKRFDKLVGEQSYAINFRDGKSYTIDWATPASIPFLVGAQFFKTIEEEGLSFKAFADSIGAITEPVIGLSMLDGLRDFLESDNYSDNGAPTAAIESILSNFILQHFPTLGGKIKRIASPQKKNYYFIDKNSDTPEFLQELGGSIASKLPFEVGNYQASVDLWGRIENYGGVGERLAENLISPGYYSEDNYTDVDNEILRLYESTGNGDVFPKKMYEDITISGNTYYMNAEQYKDAAVMLGERRFDMLSRLFNDEIVLKNQDTVYSEMTDSEKSSIVMNVYKQALDETKYAMLDDVKGNTEDSSEATAIQIVKSKEDEANSINKGNPTGVNGVTYVYWKQKNNFIEQAQKAIADGDKKNAEGFEKDLEKRAEKYDGTLSRGEELIAEMYDKTQNDDLFYTKAESYILQQTSDGIKEKKPMSYHDYSGMMKSMNDASEYVALAVFGNNFDKSKASKIKSSSSNMTKYINAGVTATNAYKRSLANKVRSGEMTQDDADVLYYKELISKIKSEVRADYKKRYFE